MLRFVIRKLHCFLGIVFMFLYVELQRIMSRITLIFNHVRAYCIRCFGGACAMCPISIMIIAFDMLSSSRMPHSGMASHRLIIHMMYRFFLYLIDFNMYVM
jgi:hypothetical protein